jgi:peroxiredoxin Q/BCP
MSMKARDFQLPDQTGKTRSLADFAGKWVILYFYPKDDTPGCTKEACNFRDSVDSHRKFADKYHLNFPILSDQSLEVIKDYGAWGQKKFMGKTFEGTLRNTYLINPRGEIHKVYEKVNPLLHAGEILAELEKDLDF